jgi:hypothetical protein
MIRKLILLTAQLPQERPSFLLKQQQQEGAGLDRQIADNLRRLGYEF